MNPLVDLCIGLMAVLALVHVTRRPRPVHRTTAFLLALISGVLLWANLRPTGWQEGLGGVDPPEALDPVTRALFWRGWPLSPCMVCLVHGLRFHPSGVEQCALVLDSYQRLSKPRSDLEDDLEDFLSGARERVGVRGHDPSDSQ
jgi:hypothetical protein